MDKWTSFFDNVTSLSAPQKVTGSHKIEFDEEDKKGQAVPFPPEHRATNPILQSSLKSPPHTNTHRTFQHFSGFTVLDFPQ